MNILPRFSPEQVPSELDLSEDEEEAAGPAPVEKQTWPKAAVERLEVFLTLAARGVTTEFGLLAAFKGADKKIVAQHLETLVMLGEVGGGEQP